MRHIDEEVCLTLRWKGWREKFDCISESRYHCSSSGSGARGAARNCDFLAESIATINPSARVRCVLDGIDFVPYWVQSPNCFTAEHRFKENQCRVHFLTYLRCNISIHEAERVTCRKLNFRACSKKEICISVSKNI